MRLSGLSAPTVSSAVAHLESLGLVESMGDGESSGGRPPGLLRFNASHGLVAAADIGGTRLRMMLADLNGYRPFELVHHTAQAAEDAAVCLRADPWGTAKHVPGERALNQEDLASYGRRTWDNKRSRGPGPICPQSL